MNAKQSDCSGCRNDFYNDHNPLGVKECWSLKDATMVKVIDIHVDQAPPYRNVEPVSHPSCYKRPRFVHVAPDSLTKEGYWK